MEGRRAPKSWRHQSRLAIALITTSVMLATGCAGPARTRNSTPGHTAQARYIERQAGERAADTADHDVRQAQLSLSTEQVFAFRRVSDDDTSPPTRDGAAAAPSAEADAVAAGVPDGYWRRNVWHQMGREALNLGQREIWQGFHTVYWDFENLLVLTGTLGASIAIRETGVDDAIRRRTAGSRQLGDADEPIQLLGHPGTHFAAAGVLWLSSALTKDFETHEFARTLAQALAVNGISTMVLKAAANTDAPNGDELAWPSGHTSSAFTTAAVIHEYYGPLAGVPALALAGLVGYQRIDSRVHDFSDVVFGAVLGYVVGTSIARDKKMQYPKVFGMELVPYSDPATGATGLALMKRF